MALASGAQSTPGLEETYRAWLLRMLGLPQLSSCRVCNTARE